MLNIIDTGKNFAEKNMQIDAIFLEELKEPILHFYDWQANSLTYGHFINIGKFIDFNKAKQIKLNLAKRPTGGGIVFHIWDFAFSFLLPSDHKDFFLDPLNNYKFVNTITLDALKEFIKKSTLTDVEFKNKNLTFDNFCMAKPTKYDVIYNGRKIAGASQRRKKNGYLHQASICLIKPDFSYLTDVLVEKDVADAIFNTSYPIFPEGSIEDKRILVKNNLTKFFTKRLS